MTENMIRTIFINMSLFVGGVGLLLNCLESYLPVFIARAYSYGKFHIKTEHSIVKKTEVPKRWFKHFYMFAAPASTFVLYLVVRRYLFGAPVPSIVIWILDLLLGTQRKPLVTSESTFLGAILIFLQSWKRLYETQVVSIFSDNKMNIMHYIAGFTHYAGTLICIIGESDGFVGGTKGSFSWSRITCLQLVCAFIFVTSTYMQLRSNLILRKLRLTKDSKTVTGGYKIPHGELFDYVTGALQLTEIILYLTLAIILWHSYTYYFVLLWVVTNQTECALLSHWWYQKTFPNYPKSRKALIPYMF